MKPGELLEHLIEAQQARSTPLQVENEDLAACLEAVGRLSRLQELAVPTDLARRLEQSVRARAHSRSLHQPRSRAVSNRGIILIPGRRRTPPVHRHARRRSWIALLGTAAALALSFVSLLTLSARSLPGDPFYNLKQVQNRFALVLAHNPQDLANSNIELLQSALDDLHTVVIDQRNDNALTLALKTVTARTIACRGAVAALPTGSQRATTQQNLDSVLTQEDQTIRQLLPQIDWSMRVLFTQQLAALGDAAPIVTHVTVNAQSNGTFLVTLSGIHFASQALFVLNGKVTGTMRQAASNQLAVILPTSPWLLDSQAFGVLNPDGTAAQLVFDRDNDHDLPGDDHGQNGTPVVPDSDEDHH